MKHNKANNSTLVDNAAIQRRITAQFYTSLRELIIEEKILHYMASNSISGIYSCMRGRREYILSEFGISKMTYHKIINTLLANRAITLHKFQHQKNFPKYEVAEGLIKLLAKYGQ